MTPLTISNCLRHLATAASKRSRTSNSSVRPRKDKFSPLHSPAGVAPVISSPPTQPRAGFHPDDMTPIPRPSHYYGRRQQNSMRALLQSDLAKIGENAAPAPSSGPEIPGRIDKSQLAIAEPKRLRDKVHLKFVASQPCLICGRQPSDPHHLRFAQPRAIGLKVSDEFTVPLCRGHHRQLHQAGNEVAWWEQCAGNRQAPLGTNSSSVHLLRMTKVRHCSQLPTSMAQRLRGKQPSQMSPTGRRTVYRSDRVCVVAEECLPALRRWRSTSYLVFGNSRLSHVEPVVARSAARNGDSARSQNLP